MNQELNNFEESTNDEWMNETFAQAMALFVRYVAETYPEPERQAMAYKRMLLDIADETWAFPNDFTRWRSVNKV